MSQENTAVDDVIDEFGVSIYDELDDWTAYQTLLRTLPPGVAEITTANMLVHEVLNGGFHQYFYNLYGVGIDEAIVGLELTGNTEYARLARLARERFGENFPRNRDGRIEVVGEIRSGKKINFDDLDTEFYALDDNTRDEYWAGLRHWRYPY